MATQFYELFESRLITYDQVTDLCNVIISQGIVLKNDDIACLVSHHSSQTRKEKLMNLLVILNSKANSKEILMNACSILQAKDPHSFYAELREKIRISECSDDIVSMHTVKFCALFLIR